MRIIAHIIPSKNGLDMLKYEDIIVPKICPKMKGRKTKEKKLLKALKKCWYLPEKEKKFWLENVSTLPDQTLENVLKEIEEKNKMMNQSIEAAIEENPDNTYLKKIKSKINQIKKKAFEKEEGASKETLEEELEDQLGKL